MLLLRDPSENSLNTDSRCKNCKVNKATHYKIVTSKLYKCKCSNVVRYRTKLCRKYSNTFQISDLVSSYEYLPENCICNHRKDYNLFITTTLRNNIPILEFKGEIPEDPIDKDCIEWVFLACENCIKDRSWVENYVTRITHKLDT